MASARMVCVRFTAQTTGPVVPASWFAILANQYARNPTVLATNNVSTTKFVSSIVVFQTILAVMIMIV
jgi:hypothetical protein